MANEATRNPPTNDIAGNPWILVVPGDVFEFETHIDHVVFEDYSSNGDVARLEDRNGREICQLKGNADLGPVSSEQEVGWVHGVSIPETIEGGGINFSSGRLLVYIR